VLARDERCGVATPAGGVTVLCSGHEPKASLTLEQNMNIDLLMFTMEAEMIRTIVEEALVVIALFVGMIAVWAGVLPSG
jgi:hypothetical protein